MGYDLTWENGRQLATATVDGKNLSFTYNADGIRTSKTVDGVKHTYTLNGSQIVSEQWSDKLLVFLYDESGSPIGMQYRTNNMAEGMFYTYLFEKNLQGDIIAIYNTSGTKLISYVYDAWGNFRQTNHNISGTNAGAQYNPFTYRGYYCDSELELYYLQSRYYDPFYGRFINADGYLSTGTGILGYNMYVYCCNNPVNYYDPHGDDAVALFWGWLSGGWAPALAEPTPAGEIIYGAGTIVLGFAAAMEMIFLANEAADFVNDIIATPTIQKSSNVSEAIDSDTNTITQNRQGPIGKAGRKKQGREVNEKKKNSNGNKWVSRSNKNPNRPMKKHTPGRDHRHLLIPYFTKNDKNNQYQIKWSE